MLFSATPIPWPSGSVLIESLEILGYVVIEKKQILRDSSSAHIATCWMKDSVRIRGSPPKYKRRTQASRCICGFGRRGRER
jgi:hypothetical protein